MNATALADPIASLEDETTTIIDDLIDSLPDPKQLSGEERRGIIARYSSVLEGNFIYWMTATVIAARAEQSRPILLDNLYEEVHDCHPLMLRKFAIAANAFPSEKDALAVHEDLTKVRLFMGKLSPVKSVLTMGFFEGFIQKFMAYLACLAAEQGSTELEYTDVHGVCDIEHTQGLFKVLAAEIALTPPEPGADLFEGVTLLRTLIERIIRPQAERLTARIAGRGHPRADLVLRRHTTIPGSGRLRKCGRPPTLFRGSSDRSGGSTSGAIHAASATNRIGAHPAPRFQAAFALSSLPRRGNFLRSCHRRTSGKRSTCLGGSADGPDE